MDDKTMLMAIAALIIAALIIVYLLIRNVRNSNLKKDIAALNVRFNAIKSVPLAFKLNKAQAMARRNEETASAVAEYYSRYEEAEKHIDQIQELMNGVDDAVSSRKYKAAKSALKVIEENIADSEKEVNDIDVFLEQFSKKEEMQREYSAKLKEDYRETKLMVHENSGALSIAYQGIEKKMENIESLFSSSEEWMYGNEYLKAQDDLEEIEKSIDDIKKTVVVIPGLIQDVKGVLPSMIDEVKRQYALARQRGVYLNHIEIPERIEKLESLLNDNAKNLLGADVAGIGDDVKSSKDELRAIIDSLEAENDAFRKSKEANEHLWNNIQEMIKLEHYVRTSFEAEKDRFGFDDMIPELDNQKTKIEIYKQRFKDISEEINTNDRPSTLIIGDVSKAVENSGADIRTLNAFKSKIDKSATDEQRAISQLMKLQVVINEVEVKVKEYHLPAIAGTYHEDLVKGKQYIEEIKKRLSDIPLNIDELNKVLDEAIDFIYRFYNNVNNVVGMAIMVENAIVFGNKYRSSSPEIDSELSKAEFSFINGEYTRAMTMAISCMEKMFPNASVDEKILENA